VINRCIADTSVLIANESGRALQRTNIPDEIAVSIVSIGELRAGVLAAEELAVRDRRLETLTRALSLDPLPIDPVVAANWAQLRVALRSEGRRMPANDSWIAATALAYELPILTQDSDYDDVPGLRVVRV
jgi:predicted nucleic acid-binding protein